MEKFTVIKEVESLNHTLFALALKAESSG